MPGSRAEQGVPLLSTPGGMCLAFLPPHLLETYSTGHHRAVGNATSTCGSGGAPPAAPKQHSRRKRQAGPLAGWGPGQAPTGQPRCGLDLQICRNRGLRRQGQGASYCLRPRGRVGRGSSTPFIGQSCGWPEWRDQHGGGSGAGALTSHRGPCAQPRDGEAGRAGSEASCRRALGVSGPLLRRRSYEGEIGWLAKATRDLHLWFAWAGRGRGR